MKIQNGKPSSYKNACKAILSYSNELYNELSLNLYNPWEDQTNIKRIGDNKYLHIVHSAIDYLFLIQ